MDEQHFEEKACLLNPNFPLSCIEGFKAKSNNNGVLSGGIGDPGESKILSFDKKEIQQHIEKWLTKDVKNYFEGIENLKIAALDGELRQGQLIFEEVKISRVLLRGSPKRMDGPEGWFCDTFAAAFTKLALNQKREFAFFHVAIYAGCYKGTHFVIENGGQEHPKLHDGEKGFGTITLCPLTSAFSSDSSFFVVSPPKDQNGHTTRYMVVQRALASVGVKFRYHMRAVTCESFALMMVGLYEDAQAIQLEVLRSHRSTLSEAKQLKADQKCSEKYKEFYDSVMNNIKMVKPGVILTLDFLLENCLKPSANVKHRLGPDPYRGSMPVGSEHIEKATKAYNALMNAVHLGDTLCVTNFVNQGLDLKSVTSYGKTALTIAASKGHPAICTALLHEVDSKYRADVHHKDGNRYAAIEYAEYLNHIDTCNALMDIGEPRNKVPKVTHSTSMPREGDTLRIDGRSIAAGDFAERILSAKKFCLKPLSRPFDYFYYEITLCGGVESFNSSSYYKLDIGFSHGENMSCGESFYNLNLSWKSGKKLKKEVVGCIIDTVSNLVAFTRNGKPVEPVYYLGPQLTSCNHDTLPTIHVKLECDPLTDLELPSLAMEINYGQSPFEYKEELTHLLTNKPSVTNDNPLKSETC